MVGDREPTGSERIGPPMEMSPVKETSGMIAFRVRLPDCEPTFIVSLHGATVAKMEEMHGRKMTEADLRLGIHRAVLRARGYLNRARSAGNEDQEVEVTVRDSDLSELGGTVVGPVNNVPP